MFIFQFRGYKTCSLTSLQRGEKQTKDAWLMLMNLENMNTFSQVYNLQVIGDPGRGGEGINWYVWRHWIKILGHDLFITISLIFFHFIERKLVSEKSQCGIKLVQFEDYLPVHFRDKRTLDCHSIFASVHQISSLMLLQMGISHRKCSNSLISSTVTKCVI